MIDELFVPDTCAASTQTDQLCNNNNQWIGGRGAVY